MWLFLHTACLAVVFIEVILDEASNDRWLYGVVSTDAVLLLQVGCSCLFCTTPGMHQLLRQFVVYAAKQQDLYRCWCAQSSSCGQSGLSWRLNLCLEFSRPSYWKICKWLWFKSSHSDLLSLQSQRWNFYLRQFLYQNSEVLAMLQQRWSPDMTLGVFRKQLKTPV